MRLVAALLAAGILLAGCLHPDAPDDDDAASPAEPLTWAWHSAAPLQLARGEVGCAADGARHVLVAGGLAEVAVDAPILFGVTETTELYDKETDTWSYGPPLPFPMHHLALAYANERYWALGGYPGPTFTPSDLMLSWAPGEDAWTLEGLMPVARGAHGVGVVGDRIHVAGGVAMDGAAAPAATARVDVYDTTTGDWSRLDDAPTVREHLAVDAWGPYVYAAGGRAGEFDSQVTAFDILDTRNGAWMSGPDLPTARGGSAGAGTPHGFLVAGGEATGKTFEEIELYNATQDAWQTLPVDPQPRHGLCVAALGQDVHVIAGGLQPGFATSNIHAVLVAESATSD